jgi:hypothetical protein
VGLIEVSLIEVGLIEVSSMVVENFINNLDITFVNSIGSWSPLSLNFVLESSSCWLSLVEEVLDISSHSVTEILVSLSGVSPVVGNGLSIFELESGWVRSIGCGEFSLGDLVIPGSGVHVTNSLASSFPLGNLGFEMVSSIGSVVEVSFKIFLDFPFELFSLVKLFVNLVSNFHVHCLIGIRNQGLWLLHGLHEILNGSFVSVEGFWPGGFSSGSEFSFLGSDGFLVVNEISFEFLSRSDIVSLGISPVVNDGVLVVNGVRPLSIVIVEVDVVHFVVPCGFVSLVDFLLLLHEGFNFTLESVSLGSGIVVEFNEIIEDGFIEVGTSVGHVVEPIFNCSSGSKRVFHLFLGELTVSLNFSSGEKRVFLVEVLGELVP